MHSNHTNSSSFSETNNSDSTENHLDYPGVLIIPYMVAADETLTPRAKLHFGCLASLSQREGFCWASDEKLATIQKVDVSQIKRWNKELEERGHIIRHTQNVLVTIETGETRWIKKRRIFTGTGISAAPFKLNSNDGGPSQGPSGGPSENSKNVSEQRKNAPFHEGRKNAPFDGQRKNAPYKKEHIRKEKRRERVAPDGASHTSAFFTSEKKREPKRFVERAEHVKTTDEQHAKLVAEFGEEDVKRMYERLSLWKQNTPREKWKPSDFVTCKGWVRKALAEDKLHDQRMKTIKKDESPRNREIAKKIEELAQQSPNTYIKTEVNALYNCLEFVIGPTTQPICIVYEDRDFVNKARAATQRLRWKEAETYLRAF